MDRGKLKLLIHTVKHLRYKQLYYQLYYLIRNKFFKKEYLKTLNKEIQPLDWKDSILYQKSFNRPGSFTFLNIEHQFNNEINWNFPDYGKLWTYNLNYFDFLNQENMNKEDGLQLIKDYLNTNDSLIDGKEPYPISLRGINWVKFLSKNNVIDPDINQILFNHYQVLSHNLEYHILANHLLENGFSLVFGAYYFRDEELYSLGKRILIEELTEQILIDGGHFELSPMYHQILLFRLLDCINLANRNSWKKDELLDFMKEKAIAMLSWLQTVTYKNGNIPMVNDSTYDIAPLSHQLFKYGTELELQWEETVLSDSGYRKFSAKNYELFVDVGNIGPKYQPGHAHSDTFNFELYVKENPIIVDTGISTYEKNELRLQERRTSSHNTVKIGNQEQTEVWDGFRVAQRARIVDLKENVNQTEATHDGYKKNGLLHTRKFSVEESSIVVEDFISKESEKEQIAFFHFHPSIKNIRISNNEVFLSNKDIEIKVEFGMGILMIEEEDYFYALGFNKKEKSKKIKVYFKTSLLTKINL